MTTFTHNLGPLACGAAALALLAQIASAHAQGELNLYSSRHYDTDERLYSEFEKQTGITIRRIEDDADKLMARIEAEGANSPADVLITVDAGRLHKADQAGLFQPVESEVLEEKIPDNLRHPDGHWFGISQRARVIFYDKEEVDDPPQSYLDLADPKYEGMVCTRSSSNIYMLSLLAAMVERYGEEKAEAWAQGVWKNRARDPQGGDTDQLRALVSGECQIAVSNTYYFVRALRSDVKGLTGSTDQIGVVFPDADTGGTHVNISGAGVLKNAPNREHAVRFLEYLVSPSAQAYFAAGNNEYPVVVGTGIVEELSGLGTLEPDTISIAALGDNQATAQKIYDRVGYE